MNWDQQADTSFSFYTHYNQSIVWFSLAATGENRCYHQVHENVVQAPIIPVLYHHLINSHKNYFENLLVFCSFSFFCIKLTSYEKSVIVI